MHCGHASKKKLCNTCDASIMPELYWSWYQRNRVNELCAEWQDYMTFRRYFFSVIDPEVGGFLRMARSNELMGPDNCKVCGVRNRKSHINHGLSSHPYYLYWIKWRNRDALTTEWEDIAVALAELDAMPKEDPAWTPHVKDRFLLVNASNIVFKPKQRGQLNETIYKVLNNKTISEASVLAGTNTSNVRNWVRMYTTFERFLAENPRYAEKLL